MGVGGQRQAWPFYPWKKTCYSLYRRQGRPQGRFGQVQKIDCSTTVEFSTAIMLVMLQCCWEDRKASPQKEREVSLNAQFIREFNTFTKCENFVD
jgi:hypothetical protein